MVNSTVPLSPIGPRKRAAPLPSDPSSKLRSPDRGRGAPRVGAVGDTSLQSSRTRAKSWRIQPDTEFARSIPLEGEGDLARQNPSRRLYDPSIDNPSVRSDVARLFDPSNLAPAASAPRMYDKQAHVFRSKKEAQREKDIRPREVLPPTQQKKPAPLRPLQTQVGDRPVLLSKPTQQGSKDSSSEPYPEKNPRLVLQPETRPISQEQLVAEVKGIYAGLVMVEAKCVDFDNKQAKDAQGAEAGKQPKLNNEQWKALIALHRTLLHEHHDFFLASQHPSASPALRRLASKYAMPAHMWRHGIHSFLELLRHTLPESLEHMLSLAYSTMALLLETVPSFEDTWIECLGDLGRYRMAIEGDDIRDREVWSGVARFWYSKAADKRPTIGRLYHHLAILARPNALQQLYYYARSLSYVQLFLSARESILTLFDLILCGTEPAYHRSLPVDTAFIKAHGILFTGASLDCFGDVVDQFLNLLDNNIGQVTSKWKEQGVYIAVANFAVLFGYASKDNLLRHVYTMEQSNIREVPPDAVSQYDVKANPTELGPGDRTHSDPVGNENVLLPAPVESNSESSGSQTLSKTFGGQSLRASGEVGAEDSHETSKDVTAFANAKFLTFATLDLALQRIGDPNVLPHVHISLVFMNHIMRSEPDMKLVEKEFPWEFLASILNTLVTSYDNFRRVENHRFPEPENEVGRPLPEDFNIRGLEWAASYYPEGWLENVLVDDEERTLELASMAADRKERILWLAYQLAQVICYILFRKSNPLTVLALP
jgi:Est1 DNA/RNA binding domain